MPLDSLIILQEGTRLKIEKTAVAGTMESSDIMVTLSPGSVGGIEIELESSVEKQFGNAIRSTIQDVLTELDVKNAHVKALDKGALDCTVRARVKTAAYRACNCDSYQFGGQN